MSTTTPATTTTTVTQPTPTNNVCPNVRDLPIDDAACGVAYSDDNVDRMKSCCKDADVLSYYDECGLYCLAEDQTIGELFKCIQGDMGDDFVDVFCSRPETATASGGEEPRESADVTKVAGGGSNDDDDNDNDDNDDDNDNNDDNNDDEDDDDSAAVGLVPHSGITLVGVALSTLLFSAAAIGAF